MKKRIIFIIIFTFWFQTSNVYAGTSGSITVSTSSTVVGNSVSATLTINSDDVLGQIYGTFNCEGLGSMDLTYVNNTGENIKSKTFPSIVATAKSAGTYTCSVSGLQVGTLSHPEDGVYAVSVAPKTINVVSANSSGSTGKSGTTAEKKEYSSDNTLKSLSVEGYTIEPAFDKETTEYKLTVDESTEKININAIPNDAKASISGTGEVNLSNGENTFEIKVTAENGNEKIYKLIVTVIDQNPIEVSIGKEKFSIVKKNNNLIDKLDYYEEVTIQINDQDVVAYKNTKTKVTLVLLKDKNNKIEYYIYDKQKNTYTLYKSIKVGEVTLQLLNNTNTLPNFKKYTLKLQDQEITYYKIKESHKVGLIYGTNVKTGNTGYYVYDQNEDTLSKYYDEEVKVYQKELTKMKNYMMIFLGVVAFISIIIIITSLKKGKKHQKRIHK